MMVLLKKILNLSLGFLIIPSIMYTQQNINQTFDTRDTIEKKDIKWFTQIDISIMGIDTKISYFNVYGDLGINFKLNKTFYIGPNFSYKLASTTDNQVIEVENIQANVNSFKEWGTGISLGGSFFRHSRIILNPELKVDYYQYTLKDIHYNSVNKLSLTSSYIGWTPQLYFGAKISDKCSIGAKFGYRFPMYIQGNKNDVYNPQSYNVGLFFRFAFLKQ